MSGHSSPNTQINVFYKINQEVFNFKENYMKNFRRKQHLIETALE